MSERKKRSAIYRIGGDGERERDTYLDLEQKAAVGGDAVSSVLDHVQGVFARETVVLHDEHDDEGGGETDAAVAVHEHLATLVNRVVDEIARSVRRGGGGVCWVKTKRGNE